MLDPKPQKSCCNGRGNETRDFPEVDFRPLRWENQVPVICSLLGDEKCRSSSVYKTQCSFEDSNAARSISLSFFWHGFNDDGKP